MKKLKPQFLISFLILLHALLSPAVSFASSTSNSPYSQYTNLLAEASPNTKIILTGQAQEAAHLLGIESEVTRIIEIKNSNKIDVLGQEALKLQLKIIRKVMNAALELRITAAQLDKEINDEYRALDRLTKQRDDVVAATNNANFLQLGILSTIIDGPLAQSHNPTDNYRANILNIVSGFMVGGLAALALFEQRGGIRNSKAEPNMLGQTLGLNPPEKEKLPPLLWTYLNSVCPGSERYEQVLTRRQQLLEYWKTNKVLTINIKKQSNIEKVSALGPHHSRWSENIKLISNRITMLFDLRAMTDLLNTGLVDLLQVID
jgi:hypothetical protein